MNAKFIVKFILGIVLVLALVLVCYRLMDTITSTAVNWFSNAEIPNVDGDYEIHTPEPMPTMPAYMGDDSFYDNAGNVDFGDE